MMEWLLKPWFIPAWQFIAIAIYIVVAHTYVTYRLARSAELDNILQKLSRIVSMFPRPMNIEQNKRVHDKINNSNRDSNGHIMPIENIAEYNINNYSQKDSPNSPTDKPSHNTATLPQEKQGVNQNGTLPIAAIHTD
jgi:hypothetical protein